MATRKKPTKNVRSEFSIRLDEALKKRGLNRRDLAARTDSRERTIDSWSIPGKGLPLFEAVIKIAKVLDVSIDYLADLIETETVLGELPDNAYLVSPDLLDEALREKSDEEEVVKWLDWEPPSVRGLVKVPKRFRVIGLEEADELRSALWNALSANHPKVLKEWQQVFREPLRLSRTRKRLRILQSPRGGTQKTNND
ncbi:MAG: helix-turn-helix transcriptional regulator [Sulfitobacter sp.]|nr:helix-turn-helix transcriptional regulator [Sulfitobacter sp.]